MLPRGRGGGHSAGRTAPRGWAAAVALLAVVVVVPMASPTGAQPVEAPVEQPVEVPVDVPAEPLPEPPPPPPLAGPEAEYREVLDAEAAARLAHDEAVEQATQLSAQVAALDADLAAGEADLAAASAVLADAEGRLAAVEAEAAGVGARLAREQQRLRDQAVQAYIGGGSRTAPNLAHLLDPASSSNDLGKSLVYAAVVVDDRKHLVAEVRHLVDQAAGLATEAEAVRVEAADAHAAVAGRVADLGARRAQRAAAHDSAVAAATQAAELASRLELQRQEHERRYTQLATESDSIASLLLERQRHQEPAATTYGIFLNPVAGAGVVSGFGMRLHPILHVHRMHNGLDLDAPQGAPLRASADGEVVVASEQGGYGLTVVIDHGNQLATLYSHLSAIDVAVGDQVRAGDVVGAVGSTGLSTGPHCHWEVRVLGRAVDGTPYLRVED